MIKQILKAVVVLAVASAGTAFAAGTNIPLAGTSIGTQSFKTSNGVTVSVDSVVGTATTAGGFVASSWHQSGDREFLTNSNEPKIYWKVRVVGSPTTITVGANGAMSQPTNFTGWTSL